MDGCEENCKGLECYSCPINLIALIVSTPPSLLKFLNNFQFQLSTFKYSLYICGLNVRARVWRVRLGAKLTAKTTNFNN